MTKPPKQKDPPISKAHKLALFDLQKIKNSTKLAWSFKQLKTIEDMYVRVGYDRESLRCYYNPEQLSRTVAFQDIEDFFDGLKTRIDVEYNLLDHTPEQPVCPPCEWEGVAYGGPPKRKKKEAQVE